MINILLHGLGQDHKSWNKTKDLLKEKNIDIKCPDLFSIVQKESKDYQNIMLAFFDLCNQQGEKLNLCGLSLGGILALDYAKEYPEKVNSLIIIGTPFEIPKTVFKLQSIIFHMMPKSKFEAMGCTKKEFITLVNSMRDLNIKNGLDKIDCKCLFLCGCNDAVNMKSAKLFHKVIKGSDFKIIPNASHEVNIDNPKELANILYDFWEEKS